jgi:hypothetical protein
MKLGGIANGPMGEGRRPTPEVASRQPIGGLFRELPRHWDVVEVPRGEAVEGFKVVFDVGGLTNGRIKFVGQINTRL